MLIKCAWLMCFVWLAYRRLQGKPGTDRNRRIGAQQLVSHNQSYFKAACKRSDPPRFPHKYTVPRVYPGNLDDTVATSVVFTNRGTGVCPYQAETKSPITVVVNQYTGNILSYFTNSRP
ncbi:hypothetical protein F5144DRAFT_273303 [Chaetomium tenue]|uniref:Uncharacterized protein n=1 Tax=Chaetomium tenue TaxID=1854479 RepID=A0ACB7P0G8_9PEZI|nr:hypothetical protein F5144DRAFT_273303 [Chaetomium globosum]